MPFNRETAVTATGVGTMVVILKTNLDDPDVQQSAHFQLLVLRSDGSRKSLRGNLVPHITEAQRNGLMDFMAALRTQAEEQILPEE